MLQETKIVFRLSWGSRIDDVASKKAGYNVWKVYWVVSIHPDVVGDRRFVKVFTDPLHRFISLTLTENSKKGKSEATTLQEKTRSDGTKEPLLRAEPDFTKNGTKFKTEPIKPQRPYDIVAQFDTDRGLAAAILPPEFEEIFERGSQDHLQVPLRPSPIRSKRAEAAQAREKQKGPGTGGVRQRQKLKFSGVITVDLELEEIGFEVDDMDE